MAPADHRQWALLRHDRPTERHRAWRAWAARKRVQRRQDAAWAAARPEWAGLFRFLASDLAILGRAYGRFLASGLPLGPDAPADMRWWAAALLLLAGGVGLLAAGHFRSWALDPEPGRAPRPAGRERHGRRRGAAGDGRGPPSAGATSSPWRWGRRRSPSSRITKPARSGRAKASFRSPCPPPTPRIDCSGRRSMADLVLWALRHRLAVGAVAFLLATAVGAVIEERDNSSNARVVGYATADRLLREALGSEAG